jgi:phosphopantetheine adenylyltransferase
MQKFAGYFGQTRKTRQVTSRLTKEIDQCTEEKTNLTRDYMSRFTNLKELHRKHYNNMTNSFVKSVHDMCGNKVHVEQMDLMVHNWKECKKAKFQCFKRKKEALRANHKIELLVKKMENDYLNKTSKVMTNHKIQMAHCNAKTYMLKDELIDSDTDIQNYKNRELHHNWRHKNCTEHIRQCNIEVAEEKANVKLCAERMKSVNSTCHGFHEAAGFMRSQITTCQEKLGHSEELVRELLVNSSSHVKIIRVCPEVTKQHTECLKSNNNLLQNVTALQKLQLHHTDILREHESRQTRLKVDLEGRNGELRTCKVGVERAYALLNETQAKNREFAKIVLDLKMQVSNLEFELNQTTDLLRSSNAKLEVLTNRMDITSRKEATLDDKLDDFMSDMAMEMEVTNNTVTPRAPLADPSTCEAKLDICTNRYTDKTGTLELCLWNIDQMEEEMQTLARCERELTECNMILKKNKPQPKSVEKIEVASKNQTANDNSTGVHPHLPLEVVHPDYYFNLTDLKMMHPDDFFKHEHDKLFQHYDHLLNISLSYNASDFTTEKGGEVSTSAAAATTTTTTTSRTLVETTTTATTVKPSQSKKKEKKASKVPPPAISKTPTVKPADKKEKKASKAPPPPSTKTPTVKPAEKKEKKASKAPPPATPKTPTVKPAEKKEKKASKAPPPPSKKP